MMNALFLITPAILLCGTALVAVEQTTQTTNPAETPYVIPADALKKANPVPISAAGMAHAKKVYSWDCAMCHGDNGNGKGDVAKSMNLQLADFQDPATLKAKTDGELFYVIRHGKGKMPAEGERTKDEDIWNLVHYLRTLSKGASAPAAESTAPAPAAEPAK